MEWIKIEDDLPKKGVRVKCKLTQPNIGRVPSEIILYRMKHNGEWNDYNSLVTYWMPLAKETKLKPHCIESFYEIDFAGNVKARVRVSNNVITIEDAMNGYGDNIREHTVVTLLPDPPSID